MPEMPRGGEHDRLFTRFDTGYACRARLPPTQCLLMHIADNPTAYFSIENLHGAYYLKNHYNRLTDFMKRCTGKEFAIKKKVVGKKRGNLDDEISF
jgi:hypothetical protein